MIVTRARVDGSVTVILLRQLLQLCWNAKVAGSIDGSVPIPGKYVWVEKRLVDPL